MTRLRTRSITRVRSTPAGTDADGDPIAGTTTETVMAGVVLAPRSDLVSLGELNARGRNGVVVGYSAYFFDPAADVTRFDRFRIDGPDLWEVAGEPGPWNGFRARGLEVALRRAEG